MDHPELKERRLLDILARALLIDFGEARKLDQDAVIAGG
jgi:hypothetical protein